MPKFLGFGTFGLFWHFLGLGLATLNFTICFKKMLGLQFACGGACPSLLLLLLLFEQSDQRFLMKFKCK